LVDNLLKCKKKRKIKKRFLEKCLEIQNNNCNFANEKISFSLQTAVQAASPEAGDECFFHKKARTDFGLFTPVPADDKRANPKGNWRLICARAILSRNPKACHRIVSSGLYVWLNNGTTESQMRRTGDLPAQESKKGPTRVRPFLCT